MNSNSFRNRVLHVLLILVKINIRRLLFFLLGCFLLLWCWSSFGLFLGFYLRLGFLCGISLCHRTHTVKNRCIRYHLIFNRQVLNLRMLAAIVKYQILHSLAEVGLLGHEILQYRVRIVKAKRLCYKCHILGRGGSSTPSLL